MKKLWRTDGSPASKRLHAQADCIGPAKMPPLPKVSGHVVVKAFQRDGWIVDRQRGSHIVFVKVQPDGGITSIARRPKNGAAASGVARPTFFDTLLGVEPLSIAFPRFA